jgi:hypothetical protein
MPSARYTAQLDEQRRARIYDQDSEGWPFVRNGTRVPDEFPTVEDAQAWADERLNREP